MKVYPFTHQYHSAIANVPINRFKKLPVRLSHVVGPARVRLVEVVGLQPEIAGDVGEKVVQREESPVGRLGNLGFFLGKLEILIVALSKSTYQSQGSRVQLPVGA